MENQKEKTMEHKIETREYIGVMPWDIRGLCRDNRQENGNYYSAWGLYGYNGKGMQTAISGLGLRVKGLRFGALGIGFRVQGLGRSVKNLNLRRSELACRRPDMTLMSTSTISRTSQYS